MDPLPNPNLSHLFFKEIVIEDHHQQPNPKDTLSSYRHAPDTHCLTETVDYSHSTLNNEDISVIYEKILLIWSFEQLYLIGRFWRVYAFKHDHVQVCAIMSKCVRSCASVWRTGKLLWGKYGWYGERI